MSTLIEQGPLALIFAFAIAHALADFPLQGDYLTRQKVRRTATSIADWVIALSAHSLIHAGGVWLVSGSITLAAAELGLHAVIDIGKGEQKYGIVVDQTLHMVCKVAYVLILIQG